MPDDITQRTFDPFAEIGSSGLRHNRGVIDEEFLPQLKGAQGRRVLREMGDNDSVAGGSLFAIDLLMRQVSWHVKARDDSPLADEIRQHCDECLHDMADTWQNTLSDIFSMCQYGFSWLEEVYKYRNGYSADPFVATSKHDDGRVGWKTLASRSQDTLLRWGLDEETDVLLAFVQQVMGKEVKPIPWAKSLHFRTTSAKNNPEGRSLLRIAYRDWYWKRRMMEIEGIGVERDLAGLPVSWVPERLLSNNATDNDRKLLERIREMTTQVRRNEAEGLVLPLTYDGEGHKLYDFTLVNSGGSRQFDTSAIITRYDTRIAMSMLTDVILLGHDKVGTQALGASKVDLLTAGLGALLDEVSAEFTQVGFPRLVRYNGWPVELSPELVHGDVQPIDLGQLGTLIGALSGAGAQLFGEDPERTLENHVLELAGLPAPDPDQGEL